MPAWATWTYTRLHPAGQDYSAANAISGGTVVGYTHYLARDHAAVWDLTSGELTDITPPTNDDAELLAINGDQKAGYYDEPYTSDEHAAVWSGTTTSFVDLHPQGYGQSRVYALDGTRQVGEATAWDASNNIWYPHAGVWTGGSDTWVDLNPTGAKCSRAQAAAAGQQGGFVVKPEWGTQWIDRLHASLWSGTAESWTDLNPTGAERSSVNDMIPGTQGGLAAFYNASAGQYLAHGGLWQGSASTWVDLHPAWASQSVVGAIVDGYQVGVTVDGAGYARACLWSGSPGSCIDLQQFLPSNYDQSFPNDIEVVGADIWIVGMAHNATTNRDEAMVWHSVVPEPGSALALLAGFGGLLAIRLRRGSR